MSGHVAFALMRPIIHPRAALLLSVAVNVILVIIACLYSTPSLRPGSVIVDSSFLDLDRWIGSGYAGSGGDLGARRDCTPCAVSPELCEEYGCVILSRPSPLCLAETLNREGGLSKAMSFMGETPFYKSVVLIAHVFSCRLRRQVQKILAQSQTETGLHGRSHWRFGRVPPTSIRFLTAKDIAQSPKASGLTG